MEILTWTIQDQNGNTIHSDITDDDIKEYLNTKDLYVLFIMAPIKTVVIYN